LWTCCFWHASCGTPAAARTDLRMHVCANLKCVVMWACVRFRVTCELGPGDGECHSLYDIFMLTYVSPKPSTPVDTLDFLTLAGSKLRRFIRHACLDPKNGVCR
jgi:hypothetical protein